MPRIGLCLFLGAHPGRVGPRAARLSVCLDGLCLCHAPGAGRSCGLAHLAKPVGEPSEVITVSQCPRLCPHVPALKSGQNPAPTPAPPCLPTEHCQAIAFWGEVQWENVGGETQLSCVLCVFLCPPGMQLCFSLISPPLSCSAQLAAGKVSGMLILICGWELALTMNEKALRPCVVQAGPQPSRQQNKYEGPGGQVLARSLETCQAPGPLPPSSPHAPGNTPEQRLLSSSVGRVVNISSMLGRMANPARSPYCITKFGVEAFSDCLRYEMHPLGVKVCVVEPGNFIAATSLYSAEGIQAIANKMWDELPEVVRKDYGKKYFDEKVAAMETYCNSGSTDTTPVIDAITHALTAANPYTRYHPMDYYWWLRMQIMTHLPGAISDRIYIH